ncbi:hypothetical protein [Nocardioides sp.]|uniref:hypothetical protein n=1 Tax=Nocardioides sp. TaxID=35761 RepID=UPI003219185B
MLTAITRLVALAVSFVATATASHLIISVYGPQAFAIAMLIMTFQQLLSFTDFGMGGVVANLVRQSRTSGRQLDILALARPIKIVALPPICTIIILWVLFAVLHPPVSAWSVASLALLLCSIPLTLGHRMLVGAQRTALATGLNATASIIAVAHVALAVALNASQEVIYLAWPIGAVGSALLTTGVALRVLRVPIAHLALATARSPMRSKANISLRDAIPLLTITISTPLAYGTDRLIIGAMATLEDVAVYSIASQVYLPALSVVASTSLALWGETQAKKTLQARRLIFLLSCTGSVTISIGIPLYSHIVVGNSTYAPTNLTIGFAVLLAANGWVSPMMMRFVTGKALRFSATMVLLGAPLNIIGSLLLVGPLGVAGPVFMSTITLILLQGIPLHLYTRNKLNAHG